ncbi:MAG: hypothetical protein LBG65_00420 [Puniceicoccales bacterium]|jgi:hypothetical protein|nr:hypothetical protein [Puniceicoccales bacterium]
MRSLKPPHSIPAKRALFFPVIRFLMVFAAAGFGSSEALAVKAKPNAIRNQGLFGITIAGTSQEFYGRADLVLSVSTQEYTTGPLHVTEVVIDMMGSNQLLRIYATRPMGVQDLAAGARNATDLSSELTHGAVAPTLPDTPSEIARADAAMQRAYARTIGATVVKTYPVTTHAKTVEFNVADRAELLAFYAAFRDLYANREVRVSDTQKLIPTTNSATSAATIISKLGGVQFTIE